MGANARWRRHVGPRVYGAVDIDMDPAQTDLITFGTGTKVATILGAHGAPYNLTQATDADRPTHNATDAHFNGRASVSVSGTAFLGSSTNITGVGAKGWFALVIYTSASTATQVVAEYSTNMPANIGSWNTDLYEAAGQWRSYACGNPAGNYGAKAVSGIATLTKYRMIGTWDWSVATGAAMTMYLDGVAGGSVISSGNSATTMGTYALYIGQRNAGHVANLNADLARFICGHGDVDVAGIDAMLKTLY